MLDNVRARQDQDKVCRVYAYMDQPPQEWIIKNREQNEYMSVEPTTVDAMDSVFADIVHCRIIQHEGREQKNRNAWTVPQSPDREEQVRASVPPRYGAYAMDNRFKSG